MSAHSWKRKDKRASKKGKQARYTTFLGSLLVQPLVVLAGHPLAGALRRALLEHLVEPTEQAARTRRDSVEAGGGLGDELAVTTVVAHRLESSRHDVAVHDGLEVLAGDLAVRDLEVDLDADPDVAALVRRLDGLLRLAGVPAVLGDERDGLQLGGRVDDQPQVGRCHLLVLERPVELRQPNPDLVA